MSQALQVDPHAFCECRAFCGAESLRKIGLAGAHKPILGHLDTHLGDQLGTVGVHEQQEFVGGQDLVG